MRRLENVLLKIIAFLQIIEVPLILKLHVVTGTLYFQIHSKIQNDVFLKPGARIDFGKNQEIDRDS